MEIVQTGEVADETGFGERERMRRGPTRPPGGASVIYRRGELTVPRE